MDIPSEGRDVMDISSWGSVLIDDFVSIIPARCAVRSELASYGSALMTISSSGSVLIDEFVSIMPAECAVRLEPALSVSE